MHGLHDHSKATEISRPVLGVKRCRHVPCALALPRPAPAPPPLRPAPPRHLLGQVLPDYILAVMLIVLLAATAHRTLSKGVRSYKKETAAKQVRCRVVPQKIAILFSMNRENPLSFSLYICVCVRIPVFWGDGKLASAP